MTQDSHSAKIFNSCMLLLKITKQVEATVNWKLFKSKPHKWRNCPWGIYLYHLKLFVYWLLIWSCLDLFTGQTQQDCVIGKMQLVWQNNTFCSIGFEWTLVPQYFRVALQLWKKMPYFQWAIFKSLPWVKFFCFIQRKMVNSFDFSFRIYTVYR